MNLQLSFIFTFELEILTIFLSAQNVQIKIVKYLCKFYLWFFEREYNKCIYSYYWQFLTYEFQFIFMCDYSLEYTYSVD